MSTLVLEKPQLTSQESIIEYPTSDGEPMAETGIHVLAIVSLISALRHYFRNQKDVYVIGNIFLYYIKGKPKARKSPDVMVIRGVDTSIERRSFKTWEENAVPSVIFEITSKETEDQDTINKLTLYASLGVDEYYLFDPLHEYLPEQLMGYRLSDAEYSRIEPNEDSELYSEALGLFLRPEDSMVRLIDVKTNLVVPTLDEAILLAEQEAQRADQAERENSQLSARIAELQEQLRKAKEQ